MVERWTGVREVVGSRLGGVTTILPCPKLRLRAVTMGVIYLHREFMLNKYDQYFIKILLIAWHRLMSPAGLDSTYCI